MKKSHILSSGLLSFGLFAGMLLSTNLSAHHHHNDNNQNKQSGVKMANINILGNWRIKIIEVNGAFLRVPQEVTYTQIQIANNQISGTVGCNNFMSGYTSINNPQQIVINEGASTKKMCHPSSVMEFEDRFLQLFHGTFAVEQNFYGGITLVKDGVRINLER